VRFDGEAALVLVDERGVDRVDIGPPIGVQTH
jgi:hypothetical protein